MGGGDEGTGQTPKKKTITKEEFWKLFEPNAALLTSYTIGFALTKGTSSDPDAIMGGSGTLVAIDGVQGVLTAEHVIRALKANKSPVGLILVERDKTQPHRIIFDPTVGSTVFPNPDDSINGPDLGFLQLDLPTIAAVSAKKSFYNLTLQRDRMLGNQPSHDRGAWFMAGLADEWTTDVENESGFAKMKKFRGMIGEVGFSRRHAREGFDYQIVDAYVGGQSDWPDDFGGFSGSAIWQVLVDERDGRMQISENLLSGVAFYQSSVLDKDGRQVREVTCHSSQSIYRNLIDAVRGGAP
jgi:hypothetical protein